jgi:hypothetical protein
MRGFDPHKTGFPDLGLGLRLLSIPLALPLYRSGQLALVEHVALTGNHQHRHP